MECIWYHSNIMVLITFVFLSFAGIVHALHVGNASSELTCISNIQEYINVRTLPILPHILNGYVSQLLCDVIKQNELELAILILRYSQIKGKNSFAPYCFDQFLWGFLLNMALKMVNIAMYTVKLLFLSVTY